MSGEIIIRPVDSKADRKAFVDFAWEVYKDDPHWVPPLKDEVHGLIDPKRNPWFGHGRAQLWLAERGGKVVGRISAQVDELVQVHMDPGTGQWGMFEALDGETAAALIATAEDWLRGQGMTTRARPDLHFHLGRAGPADRGLRGIADGDDGPSSARNIASGSRRPAIRRPRTSTPSSSISGST